MIATQGLMPAELVSIVIMPMRRRHLRAVLRIEEKTSSTPWSLGLFLAEARRDERVYLVARSGNEILGYAGLLFALTDGHITTIAVDPDHQGGRVGTRLMLVLMRAAIERGAEAVTLEVRAANVSAQAMYRRFGFVPAGARKDYYRDPTEDALVLWAHDIHTAEYAERLVFIEESLSSPLVVEGLVPAGPAVPSSVAVSNESETPQEGYL
ncbi:RimI Acetyltransferases [Acidimicrobiia bacterium]